MCGLRGGSSILAHRDLSAAFCGAISLVRGSFGCRDFMRNFIETEVCPDPMLPIILTGVIAFVVALVIGIPAGILYRKKVAEKEIISAEEEAKRILSLIHI